MYKLYMQNKHIHSLPTHSFFRLLCYFLVYLCVLFEILLRLKRSFSKELNRSSRSPEQNVAHTSSFAFVQIRFFQLPHFKAKHVVSMIARKLIIENATIGIDFHACSRIQRHRNAFLEKIPHLNFSKLI